MDTLYSSPGTFVMHVAAGVERTPPLVRVESETKGTVSIENVL